MLSCQQQEGISPSGFLLRIGFLSRTFCHRYAAERPKVPVIKSGQSKEVRVKSMIRSVQFVFVPLFLLFFCAGLSCAQEQSTGSGFVKMDGKGQVLPASAEQWAMVKDMATGLIWEVKTMDGSIHDRDRTFDWGDANKTFLDELNNSLFGGFSDWRLPTTDELRTIRVKGAEPFINQEFFPNTIATSYLSWRKCGNGEIYDERVKFGKIRNTKKDRRVRAVRTDTE